MEKELAQLLDKEAIFDLIRVTAARLDDEALEEWLTLFAPDSFYEIAAASPEIQSAMSWWKSSREELEKILSEVTEHVRDPGKRLHLVTPILAEINGNNASAISHFSITRTDTDGRSSLYVAGRYEDELVKIDGRWLYASHRAVLDTRMVEPFTHLPL